MRTTYVLVTAARNEEAYIEKTIRSVAAQSILPKKWVIVSDGSTDRTEEIVAQYVGKYEFIQLVRERSDSDRNFASKIKAIKLGLQRLKDKEYDFFGNLDADISFEPNYFENILEKFEQNPKLGIAGGMVFENFGRRKCTPLLSSPWSVPGAIQLFRRQCYEDIGGYIPLRIGGVDAAAEIMARMHGWQVQSFDDIKVLHHRPTGTEKQNILVGKFRKGLMEYSQGYHPLFQITKCLFRIKEKPYIIGSVFRIGGYFWAMLSRKQLVLPDNVVKYLRGEQMQILRSILSRNTTK